MMNELDRVLARFRTIMALVLIGVLVFSAGSSRLLAAEGEQAHEILCAFEHSGLHGCLVDDRDAPLRSALELIPARLRELRSDPRVGREVSQIPEEAIDLLETLMLRPTRLAVVRVGDPQGARSTPYGVVVSFSMENEVHAGWMAEQVESLRVKAQMPGQPKPSSRFRGMREATLPFGPLNYGPRHAADGWRYEFIFGTVADPDGVFQTLPIHPADVSGGLRGSLDLAAWTPITQMIAGMAAMWSPQGQDMLEEMKQSGLMGEDAMRFDLLIGSSASRSELKLRARGAGRFAEALGLVREPLNRQAFSVVPEDAIYAKAQRVDMQIAWSKIRAQLAQAGGASVDEMLNRLEEQTGVDLESDIIESLGDTTITYMSHSTGGNSFLGLSILMSLEDGDRLHRAFSKLSQSANQAFDDIDMGPGTVRLRQFESDDVNYVQLQFPGLPIPLEPTLALTGEWLVAGATPQVCRAAVEQVRHAATSLLDQPVFRKNNWNADVALSVSYADLSQTIPDGYTALCMFGSALSNFVRSTDSDGSAEMIVPVLRELRTDARPEMMVTYWEGDDLIIEGRGDRSMLVRAAGIIGTGDLTPFITGIVIGGGIGAKLSEQFGGAASDPSDWEWESSEPKWYDEEDGGEEPSPDREETPF